MTPTAVLPWATVPVRAMARVVAVVLRAVVTVTAWRVVVVVVAAGRAVVVVADGTVVDVVVAVGAVVEVVAGPAVVVVASAAARQRRRVSVGVVVQTITTPAAVSPVLPSVAQNSPGLTMSCAPPAVAKTSTAATTGAATANRLTRTSASRIGRPECSDLRFLAAGLGRRSWRRGTS
jgi:hypothetical protein